MAGKVRGAGKRVLTKDEECGIAFYYAAGDSIKNITARFNLSRSGIHRVLLRTGVTIDRGKRTGSE